MAEQEPYERKDTEVFPTEQFTGATTASTTGDPAPEQAARRRDVDPASLIAGLLFIALAILLMSGIDLSIDWFGHGIAWILLIGGGTALLVNELRRARRRR